MTTSITVKARAWGATVKSTLTTEGQELVENTMELGAHQDHTFHIPAGSSMAFEVSSTEPAAEPAAEEAETITENAASVNESRGRFGRKVETNRGETADISSVDD